MKTAKKATLGELNDGGPAFPALSANPDDDGYRETGMTLRDYFAGQALAGMVSGGWVPNTESDCAERLYKIADAMIAAR